MNTFGSFSLMESLHGYYTNFSEYAICKELRYLSLRRGTDLQADKNFV